MFGVAGAAVAAPLVAAAPAMAGSRGDEAAARLARLEATNAIRELADLFVRHVNAGRRDHAEKLFVDPGKAMADASLRSLVADPLGPPVSTELAEGGGTAILRAPYTVHTERAMEGEGTLVDMLRQIGEDHVRRTAPRTLELACVKHDGAWRIASATLA
jgi:hypothetical protein